VAELKGTGIDSAATAVEVGVWRIGGNATRDAAPYRVRVSASKELGALDALLRNAAGSIPSFVFSFHIIRV
jgi:hypothetical protein